VKNHKNTLSLPGLHHLRWLYRHVVGAQFIVHTADLSAWGAHRQAIGR